MSEEQTTQPTGIVSEIVEGLHELEQKVENFVHPSESDKAEPAPSADTPAESATAETDTPAVAPPATGGTETAADAGNAGASPAADSSASVISSSASPASPDVDTPAAQTVDPARHVLGKIVTLMRAKFRGLSSDLNALLDEAESVL